MLQDLRYACRALARARGFTAAAVATLALGIAANTVVYGIVNALLIRPLPFGERSSRLVTLHSTHPTQAQDWDDSGMSYPDLLDVRERAGSLERLEGFFERDFSLASAREAERVQGASVTPGLFRLLGVTPEIGRGFTDDDGAEPGFESVVLISHRLWRRLYDADPAIAGRTITVNARALTVVGVMPDRFAFPENQDVWLPYRTSRDEFRGRRSLLAVGLLRPGRSLAGARAELASVAASLAGEHPDTNRQWGLHAMPLRDLFVNAATRRALTAMLPAVALVLLIACANVAGLLVARGVGRARELSVRIALGATRARIARLLFFESLLIAAAGAAVAIILASWTLDALLASMPEPPAYWAHIGIDGRVLAFTVIAALVAAAASGLVPALRTARAQTASFAPGTRTPSASRDQRRLQGTLVAAQVASTFALLVAATLLARSATMLQHADIGFDTSPLLSLRLYIAGDAYDDPVARARTVRNVVDRLRGLPGVEAAAATGAIPGDDGGGSVRLIPPEAPGDADKEIGAQMVPVTGTFFDALGLSLLSGRRFDSADADRVDGNAVIVSRRLGDRFWPGGPAVGRELRVRGGAGTGVFRVVGVAPDLVYEELGEETPQSRLIVYVPYVRAGWRTMSLMVRTRTAPESSAPAARAAVRSVDPAFAPYDVMTMRERRRFTTWGERFIGRTFTTFAVAALLLACVGVYGMTAYSAAQRVHEIGVRLAIGATRVDIVRLLVGRGARLAAIGTMTGIPLAIGAAKLVEGLLFQTSPWTAGVWLAVPGALLAAVLVASFVPARRASLTDPAIALRQE